MPAHNPAEKPVGDHLPGRRVLPGTRQRRLARLGHTCYTPRLSVAAHPLRIDGLGGSSNGRTADSDSACLGSNPSPPATQLVEIARFSKSPHSAELCRHVCGLWASTLQRSRSETANPPFWEAREETSQVASIGAGGLGTLREPWARFWSGETQESALPRPIERQILGRAQQSLHAEFRRLLSGQDVRDDIGR